MYSPLKQDICIVSDVWVCSVRGNIMMERDSATELCNVLTFKNGTVLFASTLE